MGILRWYFKETEIAMSLLLMIISSMLPTCPINCCFCIKTTIVSSGHPPHAVWARWPLLCWPQGWPKGLELWLSSLQTWCAYSNGWLLSRQWNLWNQGATSWIVYVSEFYDCFRHCFSHEASKLDLQFVYETLFNSESPCQFCVSLSGDCSRMPNPHANPDTLIYPWVSLVNKYL